MCPYELCQLRGERSKANRSLEVEAQVNTAAEETEVVGYTVWKHGDFSDVEPADNGHRMLEKEFCSIFGAGKFYDQKVGQCLELVGLEVDNQISYVRSTTNTCIELFDNGDGSGPSYTQCGDEWAQLEELMSGKVSRVCCIASDSTSDFETPAATEEGWN